MFSNDEQLHHDMSVMQQKQPTTPGAFTTDDRVTDMAPDPEALWLSAFALLVLLTAIRALPWYWLVAFQIISMVWMYRRER